MSRAIKFRAWDKRIPRMIYDVQRGTQNDTFSDFLHYDCYVVMQFTGLQDNNKKDIYEGDIVKWTNLLLEDGGINPVGFQSGAFVLLNHRGIRVGGEYPAVSQMRDGWKDDWTSIENFKYGGDRTIEVVGNIYENPELLNSK